MNTPFLPTGGRIPGRLRECRIYSNDAHSYRTKGSSSVASTYTWGNEYAAGAAKRTHFSGRSSRRTPRKHTRSPVWAAPGKRTHSRPGTNLSHGATADLGGAGASACQQSFCTPAVPRPGGAGDLVASEGPCPCTSKIANRRATAVTFSKHSSLPGRFEKRRCRTCVCL